MKRNEFLKGLGLVGAGTLLANPIAKKANASNKKAMAPSDSCVLIPTETVGPFPLNLTENPTFFRQDVRENKTGVQLKLGQNFPNPFNGETSIPFNLTNRSDVQIDLFNLDGKKVATINQGSLLAGDQTVVVNTKALGLATNNYIYQIQVTNENGTFRQCKMMSAAR